MREVVHVNTPAELAEVFSFYKLQGNSLACPTSSIPGDARNIGVENKTIYYNFPETKDTLSFEQFRNKYLTTSISTPTRRRLR